MMKKIIVMLIAAGVLAASYSCFAMPGRQQARKQVVYRTNLHCRNCATKVEENVSFEKGVKDLHTDVAEKTVTIVFDPSKTDTLKLSAALRKLGYSARVIEYKDVK